jgi:hypothetical protein
MGIGHYLVGLAYFFATAGAVGAASLLLLRRRLAHLGGAIALLAYATLLTLGLLAVHLVPGAFGVLGRGSVLAAALALLAGVAWHVRAVAAAETPAVPPPPRAPDTRLSWGIALAALLAFGAVFAAELLHSAGRPIRAPDMLSYDLPTVGRWIQSRSVWPTTELFPLQVHGTYPQNANVLVLALVLPWRSEAFVRALDFVYLPVAGVSVYAIARELRAARSSAVLFGAMFASLPVTASMLDFALPDVAMYAMFGAGIALLLAQRRTGRTSELVLAAAALGFAFGAKWYGVTSVVVVVAAWICCALVTSERRHLLVRRTSIVVGVVLATGGFWLLRNAVQAGDPLYPQRVHALGVTLFDAPRDVLRAQGGYTIAHYLGDWSAWRHDILPALRHTFSLGGLLALAAAVAAVVWGAAARGARGPGRSVVLAALVALALAIAYALTPYSAFGPRGHPLFTAFNARYGVPAALVGSALCAVVAARLGRLRPVAELAGLVAVVLGLRAVLHPGAGLTVACAVGLVLAAVARLRLRGSRLPRATRPLLGLAGAGVVALGGIGYAVERRLEHRRYRDLDATVTRAITLAGDGRRIGLAGFWNFSGVSPAWALYGPRLQNGVRYVGRLDGDHLTQYATRARWRRALSVGGYDLVLVARNPPPIATPANEPAWAVLERLPAVAATPAFALYRGPGCGRRASTCR